jgi:dolichyl-phosphate beta-glucosyltransferase
MQKLSSKNYFSIIIPAFNESKRVTETLSKIFSYMREHNCSYEIIVVDDCSSDDTKTVVERWSKANTPVTILANDKNMGKGYSVRKGMLAGRGKFLFFSDADLSTPVEEIEKLMPWFPRGFDVVIGSRGLPDSNVVRHQPLYREKGGQIFNVLVQLLILKGIKDTQCGFKCFRREAGQYIFQRQTLNGFCFDVEALFIANQSGYRIKEVPVTWYNEKGTKVNFLKDPLKMFLDLLRIRMNFFMNKERERLPRANRTS